MKHLDPSNRFVTIITCGSKGNELNMSQMISCLGQQNVENKRIPYSFTNRTLPHYKQFDDNPIARGFVESSFIEGLTPEELFFHAIGGRVGLIDTAVKTSTTGYIQRRLIKGLEDIQSGSYDDNRFEQEMIFYIEKLDISEEKMRLSNHLDYFLNLSMKHIY